MELIKSINDVKGNVRLGQINDIDVYLMKQDTRYKYKEAHTIPSFFGLSKKEIKAGWFDRKRSLDKPITSGDYWIVVGNEVFDRPQVVFSFISTDQKHAFSFDNNKQAAKFVREITKLLTLKQEWLKLV